MDLTPYTGTGAKLPNGLLAAVLRKNSAIRESRHRNIFSQPVTA